ncbi:MAG: hypothetical protein CBD58_05355 [bacterium TMED198]|nr:MAG: hypothetical protein CBD58_05355 [bacterium TMED198]
MNRRKLINRFIFTTFCLAISFSQGFYDANISEYESSFLSAEDRTTEFKAGEVAIFSIDMKMKEGYYVYSSNPDMSLSPTYIEWDDPEYLSKIGILEEPIPKIEFDESFKMDVGKHYSSVQFNQYSKLHSDLSPGSYNLTGAFFYQVCDVTKCIPHVDEVSYEFKVVEGLSVGSDYQIKTSFASSGSMEELNEKIDEGLGAFLLFAFGMGLLALLTPCVFPMIPITVSFFTKEGEKEGNKPIKSALVYAIGIIVIYTSLGFLMALILGASGANQIASNPWMNLFIASLFIYFALSLFGMYEIELPSFIRQYSLNQESKGGMVGVLFMALTFTLTSFTCTVQFIGLLLVAASQGDFVWPLIGMLSFSTAFALPFFFLALFPQYLSKMPKSGGWLNSVKVIMGFLELGAAMKFISNADLVWGWMVFDRQLVLASWAIITLLMGVYLLGKIKLPHDVDQASIGVPRLMISIVFLTFSLYLSAGLFGQKVYGMIDSYLPPDLSPQVIVKNEKSSEYWYYDLDDALVVAKEQKKPIFIDFTGYTCTNCRWMETNVFVDPQVKELFGEFVLAKLYTDGKEPVHKKNQKMEIERFQTAALPFYVTLTYDDKEISRFPGMDTDVSKFVSFLRRSLD